MPVGITIRTRRGTAAQWAATNPVLADGELGIETDSHKMKAGDDVTHWNDLPYVTGPVDGDNVDLQIKRDTETNLAASTTPIPDGTLVYNQTTGRMKIGDGETLWANLPDPGKQFKNVITVAKDGVKGSADFICSDSRWNSDDECIQAAIDSLPSTGGVVYISKEFYNIFASINFKGKSNIHIFGDATLVRAENLTTPIFTNNSGSFGTARVMQTTYGIGVKTVALANTSDFEAGDIVRVVELASTNYERMDIIETVDSTTITMQHGLKWGGNTSSSITSVSGISSNIHIEGLSLTDASYVPSTKLGLIYLNFMHKVTLSNIKLFNCSGAAIQAAYSKDISIDNININGVLHDTLGYGISVGYGTSDVIINNCIINGTRHATTGDRAYDISISNVIANGITTLSNTAQSFDTHQYMKDISYANCISNGAYGGLNIRGQRINITNMIINSTCSTALTIQSTAKDVFAYGIQIHNTGVWGGNSIIYPVNINSTNILIDVLKIIQDSASASNTMRGIVINGSQDVRLSNIIIDDRLQTEFIHGIELSGTNSNIHISCGKINTYQAGQSILINTNTSNCTIRDIEALEDILDTGTNTKIVDVSSHVVESTGTATIPTSQTSVAVTHNLASTPTRVQLTPTTPTAGKQYYISEKAATTFTITIDSSHTADISFDWSAVV